MILLKKTSEKNLMKGNTNDLNIIESIEMITQNIKKVTSLHTKSTKGGKDQDQDHLLKAIETISKIQ